MDAWQRSLPGTMWRVVRSSDFGVVTHPHLKRNDLLMVVAKPSPILHEEAEALLLINGASLKLLRSWEGRCEQVT